MNPKWKTPDALLALAGWLCVLVAVLVGGTASGVALLVAAPFLAASAIVGNRLRTGQERTAWVVGLTVLSLVCVLAALVVLA